MNILIDNDKKGQLYIEWEQAPGVYKRAWVQRKNPLDKKKNWANVPDGRYLNVVRVKKPQTGPAGNATDFPIYSDSTDHEILIKFVMAVCSITGINLNQDQIISLSKNE